MSRFDDWCRQLFIGYDIKRVLFDCWLGAWFWSNVWLAVKEILN